ncbi:hypothetical protein D9615_007777 [Tricholomella constricta]|uniref:HAT C-terminal dimerisation domain-containing protein n=1 Tax=Tricholomella constricta TaxID=117010 RepID=A0A8H5M0A9_9AGAR|nr:hypothetical protein D9615_007777 [Tricholomella constricta]
MSNDDQLAAGSSHLPQGRGLRKKKTTALEEAIALEHLDENGNTVEPKNAHPRAPTKRKRRFKKSSTVPGNSGEEDDDAAFLTSSESGVSSEVSDDDMDIIEITNDELADMLPSKTVPTTSNSKKGATRSSNKSKAANLDPPQKKRRTVTVEDFEDEDSPQEPVASKPSAQGTSRKMVVERLRNPVYLFYEVVDADMYGEQVPGSKYYKCYHGNRKILTITKLMKSNLNGLISHLKHFPPMERLYLALKHRSEPPTPKEIAIAANKSTLNAKKQAEYLQTLETVSSNIKKAFEKQNEQAAGPWDQEHFEKLLAEWIVACDQPFDEVEKPEFINMMKYTHRSATSLKLPGRNVIKRRIMKMGEETVEGIQQMFKELEGNISISLDAWTSSNQHAFLAIIAHYITNEGELEELLIDFRELVGEHSGENMAEAVWETLKMYELIGRVIAFMMDNASNNDTLVEGIARRCLELDIPFSVSHARMRCMPHTIHLAALKLLEGIGAISKADSKKVVSRGGNYQEVVSVPISRDADDDAVAREDNSEPTPNSDDIEGSPVEEMLSAVGKRRQTWFKEIAMTTNKEDDEKSPALMLILDVKTRWSSTHQMLRRALDYQDVIEGFVSRHRDLRQHELSESDWRSLVLVTDWLKSFRSATTQMSATKLPMLSTTHAIFRGLQDELKSILRSLPDTVDVKIKTGLIEAHRKLSDYYHKFDESPFYMWSALLDPRISYEVMKDDYANDFTLAAYLEESKEDLATHFHNHYAGKHTAPSQPSAPLLSTPSSSSHSPQKNFVARFQRKTKAFVRDELAEYYKLTQDPEDFMKCNPVQWWTAHRAQFPNLFWLARDILTIPGSAVAVERIFSGGRDTISLRRASLHPETIRVLMLVKKRLHLARAQVNAALRPYPPSAVIRPSTVPDRIVQHVVESSDGRRTTDGVQPYMDLELPNAGIPGPIPEDFDIDAHVALPDVLMVPEIPLQTRIERNMQIEKYNNQSIFKTITAKETPCPWPEDLDIGPPLKHGYAFTDDEFKELIKSETLCATLSPLPVALIRFTEGKRTRLKKVAEVGRQLEKEKDKENETKMRTRLLGSMQLVDPVKRVPARRGRISIPTTYLLCIKNKMCPPLNFFTNERIEMVNYSPQDIHFKLLCPWADEDSSEKVQLLDMPKMIGLWGSDESPTCLTPFRFVEASNNLFAALELLCSPSSPDSSTLDSASSATSLSGFSYAMEFRKHRDFFVQLDNFELTYPDWYPFEVKARRDILKGVLFDWDAYASEVLLRVRLGELDHKRRSHAPVNKCPSDHDFNPANKFPRLHCNEASLPSSHLRQSFRPGSTRAPQCLICTKGHSFRDHPLGTSAFKDGKPFFSRYRDNALWTSKPYNENSPKRICTLFNLNRFCDNRHGPDAVHACLFYIDHVHPFSARPANSNSGQISNASIDIWHAEARPSSLFLKYEDDIEVFRFPVASGPFHEGSYSYAHDRESIMKLIEELNIPWHPEKTDPCFSTTFTYIGFAWDLVARTVSLPEKKCLKYLSRVSGMLDAHISRHSSFTLRDIQVIHGTLVHVSFVFPEGSSHLPPLSNFMAGYEANSFIPPDYQPLLYTRFLESLSSSTRQSYGAGLLRFTQFCDRLRIPEEQHMLASDLLLSMFVADASGSHSDNCIRNWLNGLRSWHILNRAEWHGQDPWVLTYWKVADKLGVPFKRLPRSPITAKHLLALHQKLDLKAPRDAAIWAAALTAFWGCRHLGKLLSSSTCFPPAVHVSRASNITSSIVNGSKR